MSRKNHVWMLMLVMLAGLFFTVRPVTAAEVPEKQPAVVEMPALAKNTRAAVKVDAAKIYAQPSLESSVVKTAGFGTKMDNLYGEGAWLKVAGGYIRKSDVVLYDKTKKHIALTFDDGPSRINTKTVLTALKKHKAKATFFVVGRNVNKSTSKLLIEAKSLGCELGNHTYSHVNLRKSSLKKIKNELKKTDDRVKQYTGAVPTLVRAPYGAVSSKALKVFGRPHIYWTMDTLDWKYRNTSRLVKYVSRNAKDGKIVLMHDIHKTTAKAVDKILTNLKKQGYEMVTVTELSAIKSTRMKAGKTYYSFYGKKK